MAPKSVKVAIITVSDTRTMNSDDNARIIKNLLEKEGHRTVKQSICVDEPFLLNRELDDSLDAGVDAIIINGGTGIAPRDITIETVGLRIEKKIDGFGELFRQLSYQDIGSPAMLSRAVAGTFAGVAVFCLPGSPEAVRLGMERLILPELSHLVGLMKR